MKEMTIEQKAKAYDKAITHARLLLKTIGNATLGNLVLKNEFENMFSELKKNENEKMKKVISDILLIDSDDIREILEQNNVLMQDIDNWLEKQNSNVDNANKEYWRGYREGKQEILDKYAELEKQDEQKPADKVEPKFKAGDWVVCKNGSHPIFQVIERSWPNAKYRDIKGTEIFLNVFTLDKQYRPWTIQDAKDGDMLAAHECLVLFREIDGLNIRCYCTYHFMNNPSFYVDTLQNKGAFLPATKEQRDLLFQKIKEAGYEWDAENKELKNVEQKLADYIPKFHVGDKLVSTKNPRLTYDVLEVGHINELGNPEYKVEIFTDGKVSNPRNIHYMECYKVDEWAKQIEQKTVEWGEEDANHVKSILSTIECCKAQFPNAQAVVESYNADIDWLKSLKDRVLPQPKQEWSEEDELNIKELLYLVKTNYLSSVKPHDRLISFLESLKDRVQLQDRINIEVWVTKNKQWILKLNGKVIRGQWGDEPQCIYKQFFYLSEIESLKE